KWKREVSLIIIKGTGGKAFCSGGDVRAAFEAAKLNDPSAHDFFRGIYGIANTVDTMKIPYIAFIDGLTMGGGVGLSLQGTQRIATEKTIFSMPEVVIGWFTDVGASHFLPRLPHWLGTFYGLTGHRLTGLDVLKGGIATHYCESSKLPSVEKDLLNITDPKLITEMLDDYTESCLKNTNHEFSLQCHLEKIEKKFSKNSIEEIFEALRMDGSAWCLKQLKIMKKMSPTSLKVIHRMILEGQKLTLQECLNMEMGICYKFLEERGDFYEGTRAVLVDKDFKPRWYPSTVYKVSKEKVDKYFEPLSPAFRLKF
uniref:3-hydroxyisobutyryl-CoA hydrolase, mitochondrial n=1 Tax=Strigamia maritima TaxID=126957 RepID=T1JKU8_STRMM